MTIRLKPWQLAVALVLVCGAAIGLARWFRISQVYDGRALLAALPVDGATLVYIDAGLLRKTGILDLLAGSRATEEADYRAFVEKTGFDYRRDLDAVAAAFVQNRVYFTVRGRFDWAALSRYARQEGGSCQHAVCTIGGSAPDRKISFYALRRDVLAVAVSTDPVAVQLIGPPQTGRLLPLPPEPVWISIPASKLADSKILPESAQPLFAPLARSQNLTFAIGAKGDRLEVRLEAACQSPQAAQALASQLTSATEILRRAAEQNHLGSDPRELSAILIAGSFERNDSQVTGRWPVDRRFIEALAGGDVP